MACGVVPVGQPTFVGNDQLIPSPGNDAGLVQQVELPDQLLGGPFAAPAHLATPEADLLLHLQTAPLNSPLFDNLGAPQTSLAADPLTPDVLDGGVQAPVDTGANILDQGVD